MRTAIHDLDAFLISLTEAERSAVMASPDVQALESQLLQGFLRWLLLADVGLPFLKERRELAEQLYLTAKRVREESAAAMLSEADRLRAEVEELRAALAAKNKGGGNGKS